MAQAIRVAILGAGRPGIKHAEGYRDAGGFEVSAVADLIPGRRKKIVELFPAVREAGEANEIVNDPQIDLVSVCLPNHLHAPVVMAALKAGKHVLCETPPATNAADARKMAQAAARAGKLLMYAAQRRFGGAEQAAGQAVAKGYAGEIYHARASWMRTRGVPSGTGWFTEKSKSGGGALIDLGIQMLDIAWRLMGQPKPTSAFGMTHGRFRDAADGATFDVEDAAIALLKFEGGKSLELSASWSLNQSPRHHGTTCRLHGDKGAIDVYTPNGPVLFRNFKPSGEATETPLKQPKTVLYAAMMKHLRTSISGGQPASPSGDEGMIVMQMIDAIYKSAQTGKSVEVR